MNYRFIITWFLLLALAIFAFRFCWKNWEYNKRYPSIDKLKISNGVIHHPTYGDYPEKIPFKKGMTIMPGQTAICELSFENTTLNLKNPTEESQ